MAKGLLPLTVVGAGTADVESLASYFHRVRRLNHGGTGTWLARISRPDAPRDPGARNIRLLGNINTYGDVLVQWLHHNGCPPEVLNLGFNRAPWLRSNTFRKGRAWCPHCLHEEPGIERTLWTFSDYRVCVEHHCPIEDQCPQCGWRARFPSSHVHQPGHCDSCGASLGAISARLDTVPAWDSFCADSVVALVRTYQLGGKIDPPWPTERLGQSHSMLGLVLLWAWLTGRDPFNGGMASGRNPRPLPDDQLHSQVAALVSAGAPHLENQQEAIATGRRAQERQRNADRREYKAEWRRRRLGRQAGDAGNN